MKLLLWSLAIAAVNQVWTAVVTKTSSPLAHDDQDDVVKVVEADVVADINEKPGSIALATKASRDTNNKIEFASDDQEEVVKVVDADVVADSSENEERPMKLLTQTAGKIADTRLADTIQSKETTIKGTDEDEVVANVDPDIVQDYQSRPLSDVKTAGTMNAKIEFRDEDGDVVQPDLAKRGAAGSSDPDAFGRGNISSTAAKNKRNFLSAPVDHKLNALVTVRKKHLRGVWVDGEEYVDPSQSFYENEGKIGSVGDNDYVEVTPVLPQSTQVEQTPPKVVDNTPLEGKVVTADVVDQTPPKAEDNKPPQDDKVMDNAPREDKVVTADVGDQTPPKAEDSTPPHDDKVMDNAPVEGKVVTADVGDQTPPKAEDSTPPQDDVASAAAKPNVEAQTPPQDGVVVTADVVGEAPSADVVDQTPKDNGAVENAPQSGGDIVDALARARTTAPVNHKKANLQVNCMEGSEFNENGC